MPFALVFWPDRLYQTGRDNRNKPMTTAFARLAMRMPAPQENC